MIRGKSYPRPLNRVWSSIYTDAKRECYELRTENPALKAGMEALWHGEYPIGRGVTDFLYVDLSALDDQIDKLKNMDAADPSRDAFLFDMTMFWLRESPVLISLAAAIQRLHTGGSVDDVESVVAYYKDIQPKLQYIAGDCFDLDEPTDMPHRYMDNMFRPGEENYIPLRFGNIALEAVLVDSHVMTTFDDVAEYTISNGVGSQDMGELVLREVLSSESPEDVIGYLLCRYLSENVRFRRCKYCDRYFGITGSAMTEYCSRTIEGSAKTCKEMGSLRLYETRLMEKPAVKEYKRSYKAHNARIRYGLMTREEFSEWSKEARRRRDDCLAGKLSYEDFVAWLESDRLD